MVATRPRGTPSDPQDPPGCVEPDLSGVLRDARLGEGARRTAGERRPRIPRHGHPPRREPATRRGRPRLRPRLAAGGAHGHLPGLQVQPPARARGDHAAVRAVAQRPRSHRPAAGGDRGVGGRGRDRRVLRRGGRGRPHRDRVRRSRPDPAGPRSRREAAVHAARGLRAGRVRRGGRPREVRGAGISLRGVRDPARRPVGRPPGRARRRREDRAGAGQDLRLPRRPARRRRAAPAPPRTAEGQAGAQGEDPRVAPTTSTRCVASCR